MKVYVIIEDFGYEGENNVTILGVFSTEEKAKEKFIESVKLTKFYMNKDWEFEETDTGFWSWEKHRMSRNWININIYEEEVE